MAAFVAGEASVSLAAAKSGSRWPESRGQQAGPERPPRFTVGGFRVPGRTAASARHRCTRAVVSMSTG